MFYIKRLFSISLALSVIFLLAITSCEKKGETGVSEKFAVDPGPVIKKAMEKKKFLILIFESEECQYCTKLNKEVLSDMKVKEKIIKNGVEIAIINVNGDRTVLDPENKKEMDEKTLTFIYRINGYPTIIVFDKNNKYKVLYKIPGYMPKDKFIGLLDYLGTGCYQKNIDFNKFLESGNRC
jgi:thioredoxin-related protein